MSKNKTNASVAGIVFSKDKKNILLIKRRDVPVWALPGGGVDPGETPEQAVVREIFEETGLTTTIVRAVAWYTPVSSLANNSYTFECTVTAGSLSTGDETKDIGFFPIDKTPTPFFFIHSDWVNDALLNLPNRVEKPLSKVTYFNLLKYFLQHPIQVIRMGLSRYAKIPYNS